MCSGHLLAAPRAAVAGSLNVFINNIPAVRAGDQWNTHGIPPHQGVGLTGSSTVFVNGVGLMRTTDPISCSSVAGMGSLDVLCG